MPKCEVCGNEFKQNQHYQCSIQKYCSEECRKRGISLYQKDYMRNYMRTHPNAKKKQLEQRKKLKLEVLIHYGGDSPKCACCGEQHYEFLVLDHINGDGAQQRKDLCGDSQKFSGFYLYEWLVLNNFPENWKLQVLCSNCNMAKGRKKVQFCPVHHSELY